MNRKPRFDFKSLKNEKKNHKTIISGNDSTIILLSCDTLGMHIGLQMTARQSFL